MPVDSYERTSSDERRTAARLGLGPSKRSGPLTFLFGCGWGAFCVQCLHWLGWLK